MAHQFRPHPLRRHTVLHRQCLPELMSGHALRANQFGAAGDAVAAGNQAAYRRPNVTQVLTAHLLMCMVRPVPKCTLLLQFRSFIPIHIRDKFIQLQVIRIRNKLAKG